LHARHLFGAGVVCGLEVTCFPCGGGKVLVNPGYALDCCGNDIVVACPQELDINQMVRDLQRKMRGGYDCGDPCADVQPPPKQQGTQGSEGRGQPTEEGRGSGEPPKPRHIHKYCLYVDYCEQPSDPVAPYATDDPCAPQTCETTRVREGFRFELRCPPDSKCEPAICARYHECIGDPVASAKSLSDANFLEPYGKKIAAAQEAFQKNPGAPTFDPKEFLTQLSDHAKSLQQLQGKVSQNVQTISSSEVQTFVDASVSVASDLARYYFHIPWLLQRRRPSSEEAYDLTVEVRNAQDSLHTAQTTLESLLKDASPVLFETQLAKEYAASLVGVLHALLQDRGLLRGVRPPRAEAEAVGEVPGGTLEPAVLSIPKDTLRLLAEGVLATRGFYNSAAASLNELRVYLVSRLEQEAMKTQCCLLDSVVTAPKPQVVHNVEPRIPEVSTLGQAANALTGGLRRLFNACFCNALNPPCPICDDPAVLLACITLEDCKVKEICNLDRQFVLSPVSIRYWIPQITRLGCGFAKACCPDPCAEEWSPGLPSRMDASYIRTNPDLAYAAYVAQMLLNGCEEESKLRPPVTGPFVRSVFAQSLRDFSHIDFLGPRVGSPHPATAAARVVTEDAATASELAAKLRKAHEDHEKLRTEFTRLSEKVSRLEKRAKNPE